MMRTFFLLLTLLTLSACATPPLQSRAGAVHGVVIETLQGSVNISLTSPAGQMSGNGVMFYQRPENFRLAILAPFGQPVLDIIVNGENVLCLMESRKKAWQGAVRDLPEQLGMNVWPLVTWVVEPPHPAGPSLERSFTRADGRVEKVQYNADGFVLKKVNAAGDEVTYGDYRITGLLAVPNLIEIKTATGSRLRLAFDEPEINRPIERDIFSPPLDGYEILPLADFREF
jgi:hypothetical protein